MLWVVKVTRSASQIRITLPKGFCAEHNIGDDDYLFIDDAKPDKIIIGRLEYGKKGKEQSK